MGASSPCDIPSPESRVAVTGGAEDMNEFIFLTFKEAFCHRENFFKGLGSVGKVDDDSEGLSCDYFQSTFRGFKSRNGLCDCFIRYFKFTTNGNRSQNVVGVKFTKKHCGVFKGLGDYICLSFYAICYQFLVFDISI